MAIQSRITNVAARIRDTLLGPKDQPDKAWENEQREQAKAEIPSANAHIERLADLQNDPTMQGYLDRPSRGEEGSRSVFEANNPGAHALINELAAIANDRTLDGPAAKRAIDTLITEHQRQTLGIVDRGDVYGIPVRDQPGARRQPPAKTRQHNHRRDDDRDYGR
ncbi:MAG: hypothetical protein IPK78_04325 [Rhodospirillales bacterium]|nr:hypothetical protein [Rhodospirillales bacterium]